MVRGESKKGKAEFMRQMYKEGERDLLKIVHAANERFGGSSQKSHVEHAIKSLRSNVPSDADNQPSERNTGGLPSLPDDKTKGAPLIEGGIFGAKVGTAPEQPEADEQTKLHEGIGFGGSPGIAPPPPQQPIEPVDLTKFAGLPAIVEDIFFRVPIIRKITNGYEMDKEDKDDIAKYTEALFRKHAGAVASKNAVELNFIGALIAPIIKAFRDVIAELISMSRKEPPKQETKAPVQEPPKPAEPPQLSPEQLEAERIKRFNDDVASARKIAGQ